MAGMMKLTTTISDVVEQKKDALRKKREDVARNIAELERWRSTVPRLDDRIAVMRRSIRATGKAFGERVRSAVDRSNWDTGPVNWLAVSAIVPQWQVGLDPKYDRDELWALACWHSGEAVADALEAEIRARVPDDKGAPSKAQIAEDVARLEARIAELDREIGEAEAELAAIRAVAAG
jgi:hypothetical protein